MTTERKQKELNKLFKLAEELISDYTWEKYSKLWGECSDWNREHEDEEIFMCETSDENDYVNGFMIEDYAFYYNN